MPVFRRTTTGAQLRLRDGVPLDCAVPRGPAGADLFRTRVQAGRPNRMRCHPARKSGTRTAAIPRALCTCRARLQRWHLGAWARTCCTRRGASTRSSGWRVPTICRLCVSPVARHQAALRRRVRGPCPDGRNAGLAPAMRWTSDSINVRRSSWYPVRCRRCMFRRPTRLHRHLKIAPCACDQALPEHVWPREAIITNCPCSIRLRSR